jgi:hypothetical protein
MRRRFFSVCAAFALALCAVGGGTAGAEEGSLHATFDWVNMEIDVSVHLNLKKLGLSLPTGRKQAENELFEEYYAKIEHFISTFPVDSSSIVRDLIASGTLAPSAVNDIIADATSIPPIISEDARNISCDYHITLAQVSSRLVTHKNAEPFPRLIDPPAVPTYTGIIIIANDELPVHGTRMRARLIPCLFPKLWDTDMRLIFDKSFTSPDFFNKSTLVHYTDSESIFQKTPSGMSPEVERIVGNKPLRVIARGVFGSRPTDPVLDAADARVILSSEANRELLRQGRVVIICAPELLHAEYTE